MKIVDDRYKPFSEETLGQYLIRLRGLAGKVQRRRVTLQQLSNASKRVAKTKNEQFSTGWLSQIENDSGQEVGGDKLRTLATIYSRIIGSPIPAVWFLEKAGFTAKTLGPATLDRDKLIGLLEHPDVMVLVGICGYLIDKGHDKYVKVTAQSAKRFLDALDPEADVGAIFDDPGLSDHVRHYMEKLDL